MTSRIRIPCFSLQPTLECGQFFRFTKILDTYIVQSSDRIFSLRQRGETLFYEGVEEPFLIRFFRLDDRLRFDLQRDRPGSFHSPRHRKISGVENDPAGPMGMSDLLSLFVCQGHLPDTLYDRSALQILRKEDLLGKHHRLSISGTSMHRNPSSIGAGQGRV